MTQIHSVDELENQISNAFRDGLYSTVGNEAPFRFSLDSALFANTDNIKNESTNIEGVYQISYNPHNAIRNVVVALACVENGKMQIACSEDISALNSSSYYNTQIPRTDERISHLANVLSQQMDKQQLSEYTNINMREMIKQNIENFISKGTSLPSFIHVESKNGFLTYYMKGEDIKGVCGYKPPDKIEIAKSNAVGASPPCVYVTKDMNNLFDCNSFTLINLNPLKYVNVLDRELARRDEIQEGFNKTMEKIYGTRTVSQMPENDKKIYYKSFEKSLKEIVTGQESHWLNPNDVTVDKNGTVYYQNNEVGIMNSNGDVTLTSSGLSFLDKCQQPTKQELVKLEEIYGNNEPTVSQNEPPNFDFDDDSNR